MNISFKPTFKQHLALQYLDKISVTEVLYGGAAGGGKSWLLVAWLIINCQRYKGSRWLLGRSKLDALKKTTLKTFFEVCGSWGLVPDKDYTYNANDKTITFSNGSEIILKDLFLYPSDPNFDSLGSLEITGAAIDECNQISETAKEVVKSRIRFKLDEFGISPKLFMSCNPAKNWVYKQFYKPYTEDNLLHYRAFIPSLVTDNPHISQHYVQNLREMKNEALKQRLFFGNWDYDDDASRLLSWGAIELAFSEVLHSQLESGEKYITNDVARYGKDDAIIIPWDGFKAIPKAKKIPHCSIPELNKELASTRDDEKVSRRNVIIDDDGVGGGVSDYNPGCIRVVNGSKPIEVKGQKEDYNNLRSQLAFRFCERIENGEVSLWGLREWREQIEEELAVYKRKDMDKDLKKMLIGKDEMKAIIGRSPDWGDAIMMREMGELKKNKSWLDEY